jgi:hypothetical protein
MNCTLRKQFSFHGMTPTNCIFTNVPVSTQIYSYHFIMSRYCRLQHRQVLPRPRIRRSKSRHPALTIIFIKSIWVQPTQDRKLHFPKVSKTILTNPLLTHNNPRIQVSNTSKEAHGSNPSTENKVRFHTTESIQPHIDEFQPAEKHRQPLELFEKNPPLNYPS